MRCWHCFCFIEGGYRSGTLRLNKETRPWLILLSVTVGVAVIMLATASVALAATTFTKAQEARGFALCERATARWERISNVPSKLLTAISLAESAKWSKQQKRVRAWPWTVTSGGPGSYFPTKAAAMAEVRRLQSMGVENIDVGCMQVNLHYHGHEFNSASDAMDPDINVAYAARFLTRLRNDADSWGEAAGYYHSKTPERTAYYRGKVEKFWAGLKGAPIEEEFAVAAIAPEPPKFVTITPIDRARTKALNSRFTKLKTAARQLRDDLDPKAKRARQLEAWRNARGRAEQLQHLLAARKAELAQRREAELKNAFKTDKKKRFAENRQRQLAQWRQRIAKGTPVTH